MKTNHSAAVSVGASLFVGVMLVPWAFTSLGQTQPDSVVAAVADAQGLASVPAQDRQPFGTYWEVRNSLPCLAAPLPCPPFNPNTPVYALGADLFLADETAGPLVPPLPATYRNRTLSPGDCAAIVQAQATELQDFIAQVQAQQLRGQLGRNGTLNALDEELPPVPEGGGAGETNYWGGSGYSGPPHGTNDLWLEILSMSLSNATANLVIHPPWYEPNGVYDLLYCTNLAPPISWQWLLHTAPGQTNLMVSNAAPAQGFYRLGPRNDSLGTDFWVAFPNMWFYVYANLSLYISGPLACTGTVSIAGLGFTQSFSGGPGAVATIAIPLEAMIENYDVVETNGIRITASQPVSVVAVTYDEMCSAAFNCFPAAFLGTNYCVLARATSIDSGGFYSQLAIVATADNTTVHITPSATANLAGHPDPYQTNLMQGQTYQIGTGEGDYTSDVTGTWVGSDKPIVVLAGASLAYVPHTNTSYANPLVQEQLPVDIWGKQALALSFAGRTNGASYRVLTAYSNTVITISGLVVTIVDETNSAWTITTSDEVVAVTNKDWQFYDIIVEGPVEFQASQPIQVAQFANGTFSDKQPDELGDPCQILLPPTGRYLQTNIVFTLAYDYITGDFSTNYVNVIVPQSALTNTLLDGSTVAATNFVPIGTSGYYGAQLAVTNDVYGATSHTVTSSKPISVQVYGFGHDDAYGYIGGMVR